MDTTLIALQGIILKAIPTFCLVWILYFYIRRFFLAPLEKTLDQRHEATAGLRQAAEARVNQAEQKAAAYQEALRTCLLKLPTEHRQLVHLRYFDDLEIDQIADRVNRTEAAIYRALSRVRMSLMQCVQKQLEAHP